MKRIAIALVIVFVMSLLIGCGGNNTDSQNPTGQGNAAISTEKPSTPDKPTGSSKISIVVKGVTLPFPCTVSELKAAGFSFYSEYQATSLAIDRLKKPGDIDAIPVGIGSELEQLQEFTAYIVAPENGEITESTVQVDRILVNSEADVTVGKSIKYGMQLKDAMEELGDGYEIMIARNPDNLFDSTSMLVWKVNGCEVRLSSENGIVNEISVREAR